MTQFRTLKTVAAIVLVVYTLVLAFGAREGYPTGLTTGSWAPYLSDQPVGEDGYYLLLAAWNLARGEGLTANFNEVVTGIQPLMTFLLAGVAAIVQAFDGDKFDFARAMIVLGGANLLLFAYLVERVTRAALPVTSDRETAGAFAFIGAALSFYLFRTFTYGLETGLYLVLVAMLAWAMLRIFAGAQGVKQPTLAQAAGMGGLTGLCGLARIDFGIVAAIMFGLLFLRGRIGFRASMLAGAMALAITAPWFIWVRSVSGSFMPSSGPAQATLVDLGSAWGRGETMLLAIAQNIAVWAPLNYHKLASVVAIAALLALIGASIRARRPERFWRAGTAPVMAAWSAGVLVLPLVYFTFFWAAHFYARYTAPIVIVCLVLTAACVAYLPERRRRMLALVAISFIAVVNAWAAWDTHHRGGIGDGHSVAAGYVANHLPKDARIGAFQSGVVGYYNANVINLDGKVNVGALAAMREKRVEEYVDAERIDYVIDWQGVIEGLMPRAMKSGEWIRCPLPVGNKETICVMRKR
ncbi:MAG: hypothetical protein Q8M31_14835 [Beijerinckiaceae bacterium]|nr:hypothetical protein [Beijerinckiaceae bacterium]